MAPESYAFDSLRKGILEFQMVIDRMTVSRPITKMYHIMLLSSLRKVN